MKNSFELAAKISEECLSDIIKSNGKQYQDGIIEGALKMSAICDKQVKQAAEAVIKKHSANPIKKLLLNAVFLDLFKILEIK